MTPLILLDFDGVLFDSAYEAYRVCERLAEQDAAYRVGLPFDEFINFRSQLTDAWQYGRLYHRDRLLTEPTQLRQLQPDQEDWTFSQHFFATRAEMMENPDWPKLMSPYPFFFQILPLMTAHPEAFRILSTRNKASIQRTMVFFNAPCIEVNGQEEIRQYGTKLDVAKNKGWLSDDRYTVYIDDMHSHLNPFVNKAELCLHANWGYDTSHAESYTQDQVYKIIDVLLKVGFR